MSAQPSEKSLSSGTPQGDQVRSVLHRKTQVGKADHQVRAMSVAKALRLTTAKVTEEMFDLAMAAIGVRVEVRGGDALADLFGETTLLMSLDGPSDGRGGARRAAAIFDGALVGGLIQQQTMGKVMPDTGDGPRRLTATDAAICAPFLDALLERAALLPETEEERGILSGFRFGIRTEDARVLQMTLEAPEYHVVHMTLDIAGGKRQGQIVLCLPVIPKVVVNPNRRKGDEDGDSPRRKKLLNGTILGLHVDLNVSLARISMPLKALGALNAGDLIELGVTAFDQSRVLTMAGKTVGRGTLGQIDGVRALKLAHQKVVTTTPKRRASDRDTLDLPEVKGDGTGTRPDAVEAMNQVDDAAQNLPDLPTDDAADSLPAPLDLPDLQDLPDMSDLPDLSDLPEMPELTEDQNYAAILRAEAG